jgi:uncharacterized protein (TIRG00374 family)
LYWVLAAALTLALLYWSARGIQWPELRDSLRAARPWYLCGAAALTVVTLTLRAVRWRILLNAEAPLGFGKVFQANMVGYLGNNFLPARAGEVLRSVLIGQTSELSNTYVLTTAVSERVMDAAAVVLAGSLALLNVASKPAWMVALSRSMLLALGAAVAVAAVLPRSGPLVERALGRMPLPEKVRRWLLSIAAQVLLGLRAFHDWGRLGGFLALTAVIWSLDGLSLVITARSLDLTVPFPAALLLLTAMALGSALPSAPGYIGIYQVAAVLVLTPFGVTRSRALAYSLLMQGVGYVTVMALGLPALYFSRREVRQARAARYRTAAVREEI